MPGPQKASQIVARPWLKRWVQPIANWYANAAGHRQLGLRWDDLIPEENDTVQLALKRLPPKEAYDRVFRLRRAFQHTLAHQLVPPEERTKPEEDTPYLSRIIAEIEAEKQERDDLEEMWVPSRKQVTKAAEESH